MFQNAFWEACGNSNVDTIRNVYYKMIILQDDLTDAERDGILSRGLQTACDNGNVDVVRFLLVQGVKPTLKYAKDMATATVLMQYNARDWDQGIINTNCSETLGMLLAIRPTFAPDELRILDIAMANACRNRNAKCMQVLMNVGIIHCSHCGNNYKKSTAVTS